MFDELMKPKQQAVMVPMVPAMDAQDDTNYIMKIMQLAMKKFKAGATGTRPSPMSSPMSAKPMGPIDTRGATRGTSRSINDFTNF